ncbi:MAG: hypothetical protein J5601_04810 [Elusimicrobiaceae bacterium]|nr:hypothetical protein [Elusimicrobiaceae bacterium]
MKKLLTTISALLILVSISYVYAKSTPKDLATPIKREASKHKKTRVETMCEEWPGCREWVASHLAKQPTSFQVVDAEIEHQITHSDKNETIWNHRFYLQTKENGKTKAYRFERVKAYQKDPHDNTHEPILKESKGYDYLKPHEIEKFPGHPIKDHPSEHARYHVSIIGNNSLRKCQEWAPCNKLLEKKKTAVSRTAEEQYIYKEDASGNALWTRSLYVQFFYYSGGEDAFVFRAKQKTAGGEYTFEKPQKINQCPNHPDFKMEK